MRTWMVMLLWLGSFAAAVAQNETVFSQTGQFIISGRSLPPETAQLFQSDPRFSMLLPAGRQLGDNLKPPELQPATNRSTVSLDPAYLAATAERIKQQLFQELQLTERHRGNVYITLLRATDPPQEVRVAQKYERFKDRWDYLVEMPSVMEPEKLVRAFVQILLMEAANRQAGPASVPIPHWLAEGLVEHLMATAGDTLVLDPNSKLIATRRLNDEVMTLREQLSNSEVLSLEQLSWPVAKGDPEAFDRLFRLSSHALVMSLIQLPDGGPRLGQLVRLLSRFQNWQFAFLAAFQSTFPTVLDAEKWWAVTTAHLSSRNAYDRWSLADSLSRLEELIVIPIELQTADGSILRKNQSLQQVITSMEFSRQQPVLERIVSGLFNLQFRAAPAVLLLARDYQSTLEAYLNMRDFAYLSTLSNRLPTRDPEVVTETALRRLDDLSARLALLKTQTNQAPASFSVSSR